MMTTANFPIFSAFLLIKEHYVIVVWLALNITIFLYHWLSKSVGKKKNNAKIWQNRTEVREIAMVSGKKCKFIGVILKQMYKVNCSRKKKNVQARNGWSVNTGSGRWRAMALVFDGGWIHFYYCFEPGHTHTTYGAYKSLPAFKHVSDYRNCSFLPLHYHFAYICFSLFFLLI